MAVEEETTIEAQVALTKGRVDVALATRFFKTPAFPEYKRFGPAHSTSLEMVDTSVITPEVLLRKCGEFTMELADNLKDGGDVIVAYGAEKGENAIGHMFVQLLNGIIIDATIGQVIPGHPHVFVGTREMLFELLCEHFPNDELTQLILERWGKELRTPEEVYQAFWGSYSLVIDDDLVYVEDEETSTRLTADSPVLV